MLIVAIAGGVAGGHYWLYSSYPERLARHYMGPIYASVLMLAWIWFVMLPGARWLFGGGRYDPNLDKTAAMKSIKWILLKRRQVDEVIDRIDKKLCTANRRQ